MKHQRFGEEDLQLLCLVAGTYLELGVNPDTVCEVLYNRLYCRNSLWTNLVISLERVELCCERTELWKLKKCFDNQVQTFNELASDTSYLTV